MTDQVDRRDANPKGRVVPTLLLGACAVAVTLAGLEAAARIVVWEKAYHFPSGMFVLDPEVRHRLASDFSGTLRDREFETHVRTNHFGMRDVEIGPPVPGRTRILVMGDSFAFGEGVEETEAFPKRLESLLNHGHASQIVEVLNGGVPGYSTVQEIRLLRWLLPKIRPDMVIVAFHVGNDLNHNDLSVNFDQSGLRLVDGNIAEPERKPSSHFHRVKMLLARYSSLYRFVVERVHASPGLARFSYQIRLSAQDFQLPFSIQQFARTPDNSVEGRWRDTESLLREFRDLCISEGCAPFIATLPDRLQYDQSLWTRIGLQYGLDADDYDLGIVNRRLLELARKYSIEVVDLLPSFTRQPRVEGLHYAWDGHWNARGHAVAAQSLADYFRKSMEFPVRKPNRMQASANL